MPIDVKERLFCSSDGCIYSQRGFPRLDGRPVLIDFRESILLEGDLLARAGKSFMRRDDMRTDLSTRVRKKLLGRNLTAMRNAESMIAAMKKVTSRPKLLIIGGGAIGSGIEQIYSDPELEILATDIYVSPLTQILADGHQLPFKAKSFEGVWIQAVLEHVLDPKKVVDEIWRVLKQGGVVYADTPFMQQVHEGAYDFTRFTLSGHRWLFRSFEHLDSGAVGGPGTALIWSVQYLVRAVFGSQKLAKVAAYSCFWLRYLDRIGKKQQIEDAACGVFFLGTRSDHTLRPSDIVEYYQRRGAAI